MKTKLNDTDLQTEITLQKAKQRKIDEYEEALNSVIKKLQDIKTQKEFINFNRGRLQKTIGLLLRKDIHLAIQLSQEIKKWLKKNKKISWFKNFTGVKIPRNSNSEIVLHALGYGPPINFDIIQENKYIKIYKYNSNSNINENSEIQIVLTGSYDSVFKINPHLSGLDKEIQALINIIYIEHYTNQEIIQKLKMDRIDIMEYIVTRKRLIKKSTFKENKLFFEHDKNLVTQYYEWYPILFNYMDFIKKEVIEANHKKSSNREIFRYIERHINGFKTMKTIEDYYYNTFRDLDPLPI